MERSSFILWAVLSGFAACLVIVVVSGILATDRAHRAKLERRISKH
jgi:hypothetical protein